MSDEAVAELYQKVWVDFRTEWYSPDEVAEKVTDTMDASNRDVNGASFTGMAVSTHEITLTQAHADELNSLIGTPGFDFDAIINRQAAEAAAAGRRLITVENEPHSPSTMNPTLCIGCGILLFCAGFLIHRLFR